ncbi:DUF2288 domain-containing protein [Porticoccus litoralis]|uniref:DUF2288 domain-containing protein n=1 Tax=Porticoccus litoralis TaxID=434086 RepID=A0AAW8B7Z4_9GAMM|nr:DUF2288 domain-containing protein [Porticoccus litoralis]MDP1521424.1 DUF2288 domain-containing protein [Porticoccus litoralis]
MLKEELLQETAKISWQELQKFFANGSTIYVAPELDLIDVAGEICQDNKEKVQSWMAAGQVGQVSDEQAVTWLETDALVWSVVVKPWVLVQPVCN